MNNVDGNSFAPRLVERFARNCEVSRENIIGAHWREIVCMSCGGCCFSPVIPISREDFSLFYERLDIGLSKDRFAQMFLQDPAAASPSLYIDTGRHKGRCMFLSKKDCFECGVWDRRPDVCRDFFCREIVNFEKSLESGEIAKDGNFMENVLRLKERVVEMLDLAAFEKEMMTYSMAAAGGPAPSYFEKNREIFGRRNV
ncbi:MAG: YkgJ family cysteine cluster protein [Nitrospinae bacterium]|nr:YkgJ family cysteine cluster protein [Nitrospinota bacterium]